ncbi:MAG: tRNA(fMet)-specific endonuclease VapC [Methanonatronarchaeales archaeon]|nr:tRNA(fMet)-specific endonuclease VapC [Methanonatronarchaeales archaeon]
MRLLDTTLLIDLLDGDEGAARRIEEIGDDRVATTALNAYELLKGPKTLGNERATEDACSLLVHLDVLDLDLETAEEASDEAARLRREGREVLEFDLLIASVAKVHDAPLVSNDSHMERIRGLRLERY